MSICLAHGANSLSKCVSGSSACLLAFGSMFFLLASSAHHDSAKPDHSTDIETPTGIGNVTCAAVLEFRHHDRSNQLGDLAQGPYSDWSNYIAVNAPGQFLRGARIVPVGGGFGGLLTSAVGGSSRLRTSASNRCRRRKPSIAGTRRALCWSSIRSTASTAMCS
jgi:hypothetical protein